MNFLVRWKRKAVGNCEVIAAFYVHGRGSELQHSPCGLYRTILHQILPYCPDHLESLTKNWLEGKQIRETWTWSEQNLRKYFKEAVTKICFQFPVTLFVDALDELGKEKAVRVVEDFGKTVKNLGAPGLKLKICFSCRHYPHLYPDCNSYLYPGLPAQSSFCIMVEEKNEDDIQKLISNHRALRRMDAEISTETKNEVLQLILNRAKGVFQWVVLVLEQVDELLDYGPHPSRIKQEIEKIPTGLEALYDSLLIVSNSNPGQTLKLFQWLIFTVRPLSVAELRDALAIDAYMTHKSYSDIQCSHNYYALERMKQSVRSISKGLVQVKIYTDTTEATQHIVNSFREKDPDYDAKYQSFEFIHESVRDYVIEKGLHSLKKKLDFLPGTEQYSCQFQLSRSCIRYLSLNEMHCTVFSYRSDNRRSVDAKPTCDYALRDYAHFFWIHHVMKAEQDNIDQQDLLAIFGFRNGTEDLPSVYIVDYPYMGSDILAHFQDEDFYLYQMLQKNDQLLSTMEHWDTRSYRDVWIQFHQVWINRGGHLSLSSILCLAGISSALKKMRILQPDLYRSSESGRLLMYALLGRHEQIVQDYLEDLHTKDAHLSMSPGLNFHIDGWSPLGFAVETDQEDLLHTLLDAGADPNLSFGNLCFPRTYNSTCLFVAMQRKSSNIVRRLLHAGADVNLPSEAYECSELVPLHISVADGNVDMVRALLESGANPNITDTEDRMPLSILVDNNYLMSQDEAEKIIKLLVHHGADPNHRSDQHKTTILTSFVASLDFGLPLRFWGFAAYDGLLVFLLNNGAHPGILDGFNTSALERNLFHRLGEIDIDGRLLSWRDDYGYTTLMCELMIRKSFGWRQVERFGEMLQIVASSGEYDFNVAARDGNNLLSVAVAMDAVKIVDILLKHRSVDPNLQDINGHTPLMKAANYGHKDIVKHFLNCGRTAVEIVDKSGWTAFDWAVHAGNAAIATWLQDEMI